MIKKQKQKQDSAAPEWMGKYAGAEWVRIRARLSDLGILQDTEPTAIETYCRYYEIWRRSELWIEENGLIATFRNDKGEVKQVVAVPHVMISKTAAANMRQFLNDCGLTPRTSARAENGESIDDQRDRLIARFAG